MGSEMMNMEHILDIDKQSVELKTIETEIASLRMQVSEINKQIEGIIVEQEPELKNKLKGDQITAFVGEFYASRLIDNVEIERNEQLSYDLKGKEIRVEVKTRVYNSNSASSWKQSSAISSNQIRLDGPTHLCFMLLNNDYTIHGVWIFDWNYLVKNNRLKLKTVKDEERGYYFMLRYKKDKEFKIDLDTNKIIKISND